MKRYIGMYFDSAPKSFHEMTTNLEKEDWESLRINAHSLKPQADFMGIPELKELLVQIEDRIHSNRTQGVEDLVQEAMELHQSSLRELEVFLRGLES